LLILFDSDKGEKKSSGIRNAQTHTDQKKKKKKKAEADLETMFKHGIK